MKILIATHNKGKIREFSRILIPIGIEPIEMEIPEVEETGNSFKENAYLKAKSACKFSQLPSLADDSGLCIDALGGEPGIYSARYADEKNKIPLILQKMENVPVEKRTAHFECCICCCFPSGEMIEAYGKCDGSIAFEPSGVNGFGYDPVFIWKNGRTFAQMTAEEKDKVSHRSMAINDFRIKLEKYLMKKGGSNNDDK